MGTSDNFHCDLCSFSSYRKKPYLEHLHSVHKLISIKTIEDAYIHFKLNGKVILCGCGCLNPVTFYGWKKGYPKFLKGHNGNIYKIYGEKKAKEISQKRIVKLKGQVGWSRGLNKDNSKIIKKRSENISKRKQEKKKLGIMEPAWNKGLTKETNEQIKKQAKELKKGYADGSHIPWAKGLTKETDNRIFQMSQKVKQTLMKPNIRKRLDNLKKLDPEEIIRRINENATNFELISSLDDYKRERHKNLKFKCINCNEQQVHSLISVAANRCKYCAPPGSMGELGILGFLRSINIEPEFRNRSIINPYELDFYIPSKNFAIEHNGLYFHSELFKNKNYHELKTNMCKQLGIKLFHIFEDEWKEKKDICESLIRHRLGLTTNRINARSCYIKEINHKKRSDFFDTNHIDGDVKSKIAYGLFTKNDELISCMSIRKPMHKKYDGLIEIARFSSLTNTIVNGGMSKLIKHIEKIHSNDYNGLLTYADTRHGYGSGYVNAGFEHIGTTGNRFWWTDGKIRIPRFKIRADKENGLKQQAVADSHGVVKIWGCPNLIYIKKF